MKCPVCDKDHDALLCPACGFDASRDYEQYPTFGPVAPVQSTAARRRDRYLLDQEKTEQISSLLAALLAVRYLKLIEEDPYVRATHFRVRELSRAHSLEQSINAQGKTALRELDNLRRLADSENIQLRIQVNQLTQTLDKIRNEKQESGKKLQKKNNRIQTLERKSNALEEENETLKQENAALRTALEAARSKGVLGRLFNR